MLLIVLPFIIISIIVRNY